MRIADIVYVINSIPTREKKPELVEKIHSTARQIAPILRRRKLRLVSGGTSPSSQRSYARIYLEPISNTTHDPRHHNYKVLKIWEFPVRTRYGFSPVSQKDISLMLDSIKREVLKK